MRSGNTTTAQLDGMVDVLNKRCAADGCRRQPSWARTKGGRAIFCKVGQRSFCAPCCRYYRCCCSRCCISCRAVCIAADGITLTLSPLVLTDFDVALDDTGLRHLATTPPCSAMRHYLGCCHPSRSPSVFCRHARALTPTPYLCTRITRQQEHKDEGMVDTKHKTCLHPGCNRFPSKSGDVTPAETSEPPTVLAPTPPGFQAPREKGAEPAAPAPTETAAAAAAAAMPKPGPARYCAAHAPTGAANVTASRCRHPGGCPVQPYFGREGGGQRPEFCARHRRKGMTDIRNPR